MSELKVNWCWKEIMRWSNFSPFDDVRQIEVFTVMNKSSQVEYSLDKWNLFMLLYNVNGAFFDGTHTHTKSMHICYTHIYKINGWHNLHSKSFGVCQFVYITNSVCARVCLWVRVNLNYFAWLMHFTIIIISSYFKKEYSQKFNCMKIIALKCLFFSLVYKITPWKLHYKSCPACSSKTQLWKMRKEFKQCEGYNCKCDEYIIHPWYLKLSERLNGSFNRKCCVCIYLYIYFFFLATKVIFTLVI